MEHDRWLDSLCKKEWEERVAILKTPGGECAYCTDFDNQYNACLRKVDCWRYPPWVVVAQMDFEIWLWGREK